jgi:hypothetical protein
VFALKPSGVKHLGKLQLVGPATLLVFILASEAAARALAYAPTSETLWYINLKIFGIFQKSRYYLYDFIPYDARDYIPVVSAQHFMVIAPIFLAACLGLAFRRRLLLAVASNLSFICAASLIFFWYVDERRSQEASLIIVGVLLGPNLYLLTVLLGASLFSFLISHLLYIREYRNRAT